MTSDKPRAGVLRQNTEHFIREKLPLIDPMYQLARVFIDNRVRPSHDVLILLLHEFRHLLATQGEPQVMTARLDYWQREWASLRDGSPRHPLCTPLDTLDVPELEPVIMTVCRLAFEPACETSEQFSDLLLAVACCFARLESVIDPIPHPEFTDQATQHWYRIFLSWLIHDLPRMSQHQRTPLPLDLVARHVINPYELDAAPESVINAWNDLRSGFEPASTAACYSGLYAGLLDEQFRLYSKSRPERLYRQALMPGAVRRLQLSWRLARQIRKSRFQL